jgi:hypothetical protein
MLSSWMVSDLKRGDSPSRLPSRRSTVSTQIKSLRQEAFLVPPTRVVRCVLFRAGFGCNKAQTPRMLVVRTRCPVNNYELNNFSCDDSPHTSQTLSLPQDGQFRSKRHRVQSYHNRPTAISRSQILRSDHLALWSIIDRRELLFKMLAVPFAQLRRAFLVTYQVTRKALSSSWQLNHGCLP